jgi:hypothetical protein
LNNGQNYFEDLNMSTHLPAVLATMLGSCLAAGTAYAECEEVPLTESQEKYLEDNNITIEVPEGEVAEIRRCDTNGDMVVDINDIRAISRMRNQPVAHPDDPMDWDKNGMNNVSDARGCQRACAYSRCAPAPAAIQLAALAADEQMGGTTETAACFQTGSFDGEGENDLIAISDVPEDEAREGDWTLELVILNEDDQGNIEHIRVPYFGQQSADKAEVKYHLSPQPEGEVGLNPGSVSLENPGIVSYRDGEPRVVYFWEDGELKRAKYGVDD